jgi:UbiD family decarboxylase
VPGDEFALMAALRGAPLPMVRGVTNGVPVPADAEVVLEGYLGEGGYREVDGPYGEFWGYYGGMHVDPIFHVSGVTMRADALHHSVVQASARLGRADTSQMTAIIAEIVATRLLRGAGIEPAAVHALPGAPIFQAIRVALKRADANRAKEAIHALFRGPGMKHIIVVDDDIDVFCEEEVAWAMATRFRADRDTVLAQNLRGFYEDPTADEQGQIAKIGFDATAPAHASARIRGRRPRPPKLDGSPRFNSVRDALAGGPKTFLQLMTAIGSRDGRDLALALGELRREGVLARLPDGEYALKDAV